MVAIFPRVCYDATSKSKIKSRDVFPPTVQTPRRTETSNMPRCVSLSLLLLFAGLSATNAYMPVILMHGIFSDAAHMDEIINLTQTIHPGTPILNVDLYEDLASLVNMWTQVEEVSKKVKPFMDEAKDGVNMICFSQG